MRELMILTAAAILEAGGDALVRWGLHENRSVSLALGAIALFAYGLTVNMPKWDFGRLLGVYIAVFFVVAQFVAYFFYHEKIKVPVVAGGTLIVIGGLVMTFWHSNAELLASTEPIAIAYEHSPR